MSVRARLPGVLLLLVTAACSVRIGSDGGNANSPRPAAPPPRAAAAPAPKPQPAPAQANNNAAPKTLGKRDKPDTPPPAPANPAGGARTGAMALNPNASATSEAVNVAKLQELQKRQPKACGVYEVAPNTWMRIDCQAYTESKKAVPSLNKRKAKLVAQHKTLWKPMKTVSGQVRATLNKRKKPVAKPATPPAGGNGNKDAIAAGGDDDAAGIIVADNYPNSIDHRSDSLEGPVKSQGPVGSCTAFALSAAVDNAAIRAKKANAGVRAEASSPNHIWSAYGVPNMGAAADGNLARSIATMGTWDQNNSEACKLSQEFMGRIEDCGDSFIPAVTPGSWRSDSGLVGKYDKANAQGSYKIAYFEKMQTVPANLNEVVGALASGQDLFVAFRIDGAKWQTGAMKGGVIQDYDDYSGGHAVALSGYRDTPSGRQFLVHNSWGTGWGDNGYAWISERMVQKWMIFAYKVKLSGGVPDPTDDDCAPDELVDATTNQCAVMCEPEGSRPDNGCK